MIVLSLEGLEDNEQFQLSVSKAYSVVSLLRLKRSRNVQNVDFLSSQVFKVLSMSFIATEGKPLSS